MKELDSIAQGLADHTMEILKESADWQLGDIPIKGEEDYRSMKFHVIQMTVSKMYEELMR